MVLADEPTGNLDEATANNVWQLLEDLVRSTGGTVLLATHSVAAARRCDRVLELVDGKLIAHTNSLE